MMKGYKCCCYTDDCKCWDGSNTRGDGADAEDGAAFGYDSENGSDESDNSQGRALRITYEAARRLELHHIAMAPHVSQSYAGPVLRQQW